MPQKLLLSALYHDMQEFLHLVNHLTQSTSVDHWKVFNLLYLFFVLPWHSYWYISGWCWSQHLFTKTGNVFI